MTVLLGKNLYPAQGDAGRRQESTNQSALTLQDVDLVNLQFHDGGDLTTHVGFETLRVLRTDSKTITGRPGVRKPILTEIFDVLAEEALRRGYRYLLFTNADIYVTQEAIDLISSCDTNSFIFSRMDFDGVTGIDQEICISGSDGIAVDARWWQENRFRFRPYIIAEMLWDNIYPAQLLCHSSGILCNRQPYIRHEQHPVVFNPTSDFARFNGYLAALDAPYFSLWCRYVAGLKALRKQQASEEEELNWQSEMFVWRPSWANWFYHSARCFKAWQLYRMAWIGRRKWLVSP